MSYADQPEQPEEQREPAEETPVEAAFEDSAEAEAEPVFDEAADSPVQPDEADAEKQRALRELAIDQSYAAFEANPVTSDEMQVASTERYEDENARRLRELNLAIEVYPEAAMNYVLRGEFFAEQNQRHLAISDFETAILLAARAMDVDSWGLVGQSVIDRASLNLRDIHE